MRIARWQGWLAGIAAVLTALPACANRLTIEVWPDASPDHAMSCSFLLSGGWISLVQVKGAGMPGPLVMRWPASPAEVAAVADSLQALVGGDLASVDPYQARALAVPHLTVTWFTRLDGSLASGLYLQSGLTPPDSLARALTSLGLLQPCGLSATDAE